MSSCCNHALSIALESAGEGDADGGIAWFGGLGARTASAMDCLLRCVRVVVLLSGASATLLERLGFTVAIYLPFLLLLVSVVSTYIN